MGTKKYAYFRQDIKDLISSFNEYDEPMAKKDFLRWIDACAEYTMAVVEHTAYRKAFTGYSSPSTRAEMEDLNKKRSTKHDEGIRLTMTLNRNIKKLNGNGAYFSALNGINYLDNIKLIRNLSSDERQNLGKLFFETSSIIASLTPEEVKETGLAQLREDVGKNIETISFKRDFKSQTRRYGIKNIGGPTQDGYVKNADDCYDEIER